MQATTGSHSSVAGLDLYLDRPGGRVRDGVMEAIRDAIRSGRLAPGIQLPSSRALAADLGVARNTVARAYAELIAEGWLTSQHGSGTLVSQRAAEVVRSVASPPKRRTERRLDHDLRPGHPDLSSFPRTEWSRAVKRALNAAPFEAFGYTDPQGRSELRAALAQYLARARGVRARPGNIVICSGAAEGLNLVAGALAEAGVAAVAVEEFGLHTQRASLARARLRCPPMAVDSHGADVMVLDGMADVGGVLLTPSHQFPLGVPLHSDRGDHNGRRRGAGHPRPAGQRLSRHDHPPRPTTPERPSAVPNGFRSTTWCILTGGERPTESDGHAGHQCASEISRTTTMDDD
jgi:GntR family transcriptional regulator/MocR family aminotransferase